jgi:hypothetical protein
MAPSSPTPARAVLGLLALALVGIFAALNYLSLRDIHELLTAGEPTTGVITRKDCQNHGKVNYTYTIRGQQHYGASSFCVSSCNGAKVGEAISLTYSPKSPTNSECGSLKEAESRLNGNYFALLVLSAALAIVIFRITRVK